jgi:signal transduction histidine kinase
VEAAGVARYPPDVEATAYFCCLEALQNAAKHAGEGARATVRVWQEQGGLLFEVADDGAGFAAGDGRGGAGLASMRDRVGALGGRLTIASTPGHGTSVSGTIPLSP